MYNFNVLSNSGLQAFIILSGMKPKMVGQVTLEGNCKPLYAGKLYGGAPVEGPSMDMFHQGQLIGNY